MTFVLTKNVTSAKSSSIRMPMLMPMRKFKSFSSGLFLFLFYLLYQKNYHLWVLDYFGDYRHFLRYIFFYLYSNTNNGKKYIKDKKEKAKNMIKNELMCVNYKEDFYNLSDKGLDAKRIINIINTRKQKNTRVNPNKISGGVYINDGALEDLLKKTCGNYLFSNPLHPDIWPE